MFTRFRVLIDVPFDLLKFTYVFVEGEIRHGAHYKSGLQLRLVLQWLQNLDYDYNAFKKWITIQL